MNKLPKINVSEEDMRWHGLGFNNTNFIRNVTPRISEWLLAVNRLASIEDYDIVDKLTRIAEIIDNDIRIVENIDED